MKYEVRYIVDNEEHTQLVDVENAADAAEVVRQEHQNPGDSFELIQVQLMEEIDPLERQASLSDA